MSPKPQGLTPFDLALPAVMQGEYAWKMQELVKGASVLSSAAALMLERRQGGWGFSTEWNVLVDIDSSPNNIWVPQRRSANETDSIPSEELKFEPFFPSLS